MIDARGQFLPVYLSPMRTAQIKQQRVTLIFLELNDGMFAADGGVVDVDVTQFLVAAHQIEVLHLDRQFPIVGAIADDFETA